MEHFNRPSGPSLPAFILYSPLAQPTPDGSESSIDSPGSLRQSAMRPNPYFVQNLMGLPIHWTSTIARPNSAPLVTAAYRSKLLQHLSCLLGEPESLNDNEVDKL